MGQGAHVVLLKSRRRSSLYEAEKRSQALRLEAKILADLDRIGLRARMEVEIGSTKPKTGMGGTDLEPPCKSGLLGLRGGHLGEHAASASVRVWQGEQRCPVDLAVVD